MPSRILRSIHALLQDYEKIKDPARRDEHVRSGDSLKEQTVIVTILSRTAIKMTEQWRQQCGMMAGDGPGLINRFHVSTTKTPPRWGAVTPTGKGDRGFDRGNGRARRSSEIIRERPVAHHDQGVVEGEVSVEAMMEGWLAPTRSQEWIQPRANGRYQHNRASHQDPSNGHLVCLWKADVKRRRARCVVDENVNCVVCVERQSVEMSRARSASGGRRWELTRNV